MPTRGWIGKYFILPEARYRAAARFVHSFYCKGCGENAEMQVDESRVCYEVRTECQCGKPTFDKSWFKGFLPCHEMDQREQDALLEGWAREEAEKIVWEDGYLMGAEWAIADSPSLQEACAGNITSDGEDTGPRISSIVLGASVSKKQWEEFTRPMTDKIFSYYAEHYERPAER